MGRRTLAKSAQARPSRSRSRAPAAISTASSIRRWSAASTARWRRRRRPPRATCTGTAADIGRLDCRSLVLGSWFLGLGPSLLQISTFRRRLRMFRQLLRSAPAAMALVLAVALQAGAQIATGTVTGVVSDNSNAVLPGVSVTLTGEKL